MGVFCCVQAVHRGDLRCADIRHFHHRGHHRCGQAVHRAAAWESRRPIRRVPRHDAVLRDLRARHATSVNQGAFLSISVLFLFPYGQLV